MRLVANSYEPDELNRLGMSMYVSTPPPPSPSCRAELTRYLQNEFKPDVVEWGQRGFLQCSKILDQAKGPVTLPPEGPPEDLKTDPVASSSKPIQTGQVEDGDEREESPLSDIPDLAEPDRKKLKEGDAGGMTLEEYEAMLDAEAENGEGGYLEAGDI